MTVHNSTLENWENRFFCTDNMQNHFFISCFLPLLYLCQTAMHCYLVMSNNSVALLPEYITHSNTHCEEALENKLPFCILQLCMLIVTLLQLRNYISHRSAGNALPCCFASTLQSCPSASLLFQPLPSLEQTLPIVLNWVVVLELNKLGLEKDPKLIFNFVLSSYLNSSS